MKKKLISLIMIGSMCLALTGCGQDKDVVNKSTSTTQKNRFIDTGDSYKIFNDTYDVYYDRVTNIVYLGGYKFSSKGGISVLYNKDGKPMTIDEYNKSK